MLMKYYLFFLLLLVPLASAYSTNTSNYEINIVVGTGSGVINQTDINASFGAGQGYIGESSDPLIIKQMGLYYIGSEEACVSNWVYTDWSAWQNFSECFVNDTVWQNRSRIYYDSNGCNLTNTTEWDYNYTVFCDSCINVMTNTTAQFVNNISCEINDTMLQNASITQYDSNFCGDVGNTTFYIQWANATCDYCTPVLANTSWSVDFVNTTSCLPNATYFYGNYRIQYDSLFCYLTTSLGSDYVANTTFYNETSGACSYITSAGMNVKICRYKKFGYYNLKLPSIKESGCI